MYVPVGTKEASSKQTGYYLGWVGFGNLGDEAMWQFWRARFPSVNWVSLTPETRIPRSAGQGRIASFSPEAGSPCILGGGTLINEVSHHWLDLYREATRLTKRPVYLFGTGVESSEILSRVNGWYDQRSAWIQEFEALTRIGVRGPRSKAFLDEAGATKVEVVGDPAVGYHLPFREKKGLQIVNSRPLRVAINFGYSAVPMWGSQEAVEEMLSDLIGVLTKDGHHVRVFAVWKPDLILCMVLALRSGLSGESVSLLTDPYQAIEYLSGFDVVVSFKLHAAIFACVTNVPVIVLEYTPKCKDFAESVGQQRFVVRTDVADNEKVMEYLRLVAVESETLRPQISKTMNDLKARLESYCQFLDKVTIECADPPTF